MPFGWGGAKPSRTTWSRPINALCHTASSFLAQKLLYHVKKKKKAIFTVFRNLSKVWVGSLISILYSFFVLARREGGVRLWVCPLWL